MVCNQLQVIHRIHLHPNSQNVSLFSDYCKICGQDASSYINSIFTNVALHCPAAEGVSKTTCDAPDQVSQTKAGSSINSGDDQMNPGAVAFLTLFIVGIVGVLVYFFCCRRRNDIESTG